MRVLFLIFILISCKSKKDYMDILSKPSPTEFDQYRRVIKTSGQENKKRYLYYNSLQYKNKYKREN
jgi:hypothetical protein